MSKRIVIVGGVAGGATAAARLRRLDEFAEIIMLERGPHVSFSNCGLPYYIGRVIKEKEKLVLVNPEIFLKRYNIEVRIYNEVKSIDRENKKIKVEDIRKDIEYDLEYDKLILSPGAEPIKPPFSGIDEVPVFTLRNIPDTFEIDEFITKNNPKHAVVVGGGFIGLEMAENLRERGLEVTIVELINQVMIPLDFEIAQYVHHELYKNGVDLILGDGVNSFFKKDNGKAVVKTQSGKEVETDLVILSIGVKPESKLAKEAGLDIGERGHIIVNDKMETSDPNIYAVGDAVQVTDPESGISIAVPLAGPANKQGRIAADNICGYTSEYEGGFGAAVVKVFNLTVAQVGINEKKLKEFDSFYEKIYLHPSNHAAYYPGFEKLAIKLIFKVPNGKILGAQIVGGAGAEKRVDVISTVMSFNGTVFDLEKLELTYAPPYGSAKDPVNMAGFIAANYLRGDNPLWHWYELDTIRSKDGFLVDVRRTNEYEQGAIEGALHLHEQELRENMELLPKDKPIYLYCSEGYRAYIVSRNLVQRGYEVYNLAGGYKIYEKATSTQEELKKKAID